MPTPHPSDASAQTNAHPLILGEVSKALGVPLEPKSVHLPGGSRTDIGGVDPNETVYVEVVAKQGALKGGQLHKVGRDALKLITVTRGRHEHTRRVLAFADETAAAFTAGKSWLAEALRIWDIEVLVVELAEGVREELRAAQARQVMVNP